MFDGNLNLAATEEAFSTENHLSGSSGSSANIKEPEVKPPRDPEGLHSHKSWRSKLQGALALMELWAFTDSTLQDDLDGKQPQRDQAAIDNYFYTSKPYFDAHPDEKPEGYDAAYANWEYSHPST